MAFILLRQTFNLDFLRFFSLRWPYCFLVFHNLSRIALFIVMASGCVQKTHENLWFQSIFKILSLNQNIEYSYYSFFAIIHLQYYFLCLELKMALKLSFLKEENTIRFLSELNVCYAWYLPITKICRF